jgi:hypothetical protein
MKPQFDEKDSAILAKREALFNAHPGPRVGDYVQFPDHHVERFSHDWGDSIQTTDGLYGQSFYLDRTGYADFSGGLNPAIAKAELVDLLAPMRGSFWFFHHDQARASNGVEFSIACRVFSYSGEKS